MGPKTRRYVLFVSGIVLLAHIQVDVECEATRYSNANYNTHARAAAAPGASRWAAVSNADQDQGHVGVNQPSVATSGSRYRTTGRPATVMLQPRADNHHFAAHHTHQRDQPHHHHHNHHHHHHHPSMMFRAPPVAVNRAPLVSSRTPESSAWRTAAASTSTPAPEVSSTTPVPLISLRERCAQFNNWAPNYNNPDNLVLSYVSGIETLTGNIQELDEAVQKMQLSEQASPSELRCGSIQSTPSPSAPNYAADVTIAPMSPDDSTRLLNDSISTVSTGDQQVVPTATVSVSESGWPAATEAAEVSAGDSSTPTSIASTAAPVAVTSSEQFFDAPVRQRRNLAIDDIAFGMPLTSTEVDTSSAASDLDPTNEDLVRAGADLRVLRKELNVAADWLKQTNHTVHSAMFKALQAYVTSIERRVEHQRQLYNQTKSLNLKDKVAAIREKVAKLLSKLKSMIPFANNPTGSVTIMGPSELNTIDRSSSVGAAGANQPAPWSGSAAPSFVANVRANV